MRHVVGGRTALTEKQAASTSDVGRFETEILNIGTNQQNLMNLSGDWIDKVNQWNSPKRLILDMDSSVSEIYGQQGVCVWKDGENLRGRLGSWGYCEI